ncbi:alpha/beta hydrolase [Pseudonocardia nematodicida]|uniref:Alpha/beta hydrolase n=1 Tax=Pseudonocardia nematodicida TaxID=1206997 RepID=A0ABV1KI75_9PSEU
MEREVEVEPGVSLWVEDLPADGPAAGVPAVLLLADANTSGITWPDRLVAALRARHRVLRYDHRDTGRSTHAFEDHPYGVADLAADALTVLDACGVERVHAVGAGMGGTLVQLLALDAPERLASASLVVSTALPAASGPEPLLPAPSVEIRRMWQEMADPRDERVELAWRVEYRRRLAGPAAPFDAADAEALERRVLAHSGRVEPATAHTEADPAGTGRGDELGTIAVPTLVVEGPEDPVHPPPHAAYLAERLAGGRSAPPVRLVSVEHMGHVPVPAVLDPLAAVLLAHLAETAPPPAARQPTQR